MGLDQGSRPYRKVARAKREQETRLRITEAAVELHGSVGPASTTISDVADLAGVSRMTVYNHFPTEADLFLACSTHWATLNPFPDPTTWTGIPDADGRLPLALHEIYLWYSANHGMLENVFRDSPAVPALSGVMEKLWAPYVEQVVDVLASGWIGESAGSREFRALLYLAVDFGTWQLLTRSGLDDGVSADLMAQMVLTGSPPDSGG